MSHQYVWLLWSSAFLIPWTALFLCAGPLRRHMLNVSLATSLLGVTEPIFVPSYWNPPSLFDLAQRTGFDIESFVFCFATGGIAVVLYNATARRTLSPFDHTERHSRRHRFHAIALTAPYLLFPFLYMLPWNPIHAGISALAIGSVATVLCRPDLLRNTVRGGLLFLALYGAFMLGLVVFTPGYIENVWNLPVLTGVVIGGIPLEELLYGFAFGAYWAGLYEHFAWLRGGAAVRAWTGAGARAS